MGTPGVPHCGMLLYPLYHKKTERPRAWNPLILFHHSSHSVLHFMLKQFWSSSTCTPPSQALVTSKELPNTALILGGKIPIKMYNSTQYSCLENSMISTLKWPQPCLQRADTEQWNNNHHHHLLRLTTSSSWSWNTSITYLISHLLCFLHKIHAHIWNQRYLWKMQINSNILLRIIYALLIH